VAAVITVVFGLSCSLSFCAAAAAAAVAVEAVEAAVDAMAAETAEITAAAKSEMVKNGAASYRSPDFL